MTDTTNAPADNMEGVLRRVAKLLAIAEDGRGDPNECAAAARMAESIMRKYQIDHADVITKNIREGRDEFSTVDACCTMDLNQRDVKEGQSWAGILSVKIAELNDCQVRYVNSHPMGRVLRYSGFKSDAEICKYMHDFIVGSLIVASRIYTKGMGRSRAEANAFRLGYVNAVNANLKQLKREKDAEMQQASSSRDLVIVKAGAVAAHFGKVSYTRKGGGTRQGDAFAYGREQGSNLDLGRRGVGHSGGSALRIGS